MTSLFSLDLKKLWGWLVDFGLSYPLGAALKKRWDLNLKLTVRCGSTVTVKNSNGKNFASLQIYY